MSIQQLVLYSYRYLGLVGLLRVIAGQQHFCLLYIGGFTLVWNAYKQTIVGK